MFSIDSLRLVGKMGLSWVLYTGVTHIIVSSGCVDQVVSTMCNTLSLHCETHEYVPSKAASIARIVALMSTYTGWVVHNMLTNKL